MQKAVVTACIRGYKFIKIDEVDCQSCPLTYLLSPLISEYLMLSFEEARAIILRNITPLGTEQVPLTDALGRVIAIDIHASWDMPLCDNSAMDGYAVRAGDCSATPVQLKVTGYIPAGGDASFSVDEGCAVRIMTGAPLPAGADTVVPVEDTDEGAEVVTIQRPVKKGEHVRFTGEDVAAGSVIVPAGTLVRPPEISMLASFNQGSVPVYRRPRVAILSTGDELIEMGKVPVRGEIINSNSLSLAAAVREAGGEPVLLGIARDNREDHVAKLSEGLKADALITSAGVSTGDRDLVRDVLVELGAMEQFWKPAIKPGGPAWFGMRGETPLFALPGNPVATMVTFELFVRPALLKMQGHRRVIRPLVPVVLADPIRKKPGKAQFVRLRLERDADRFIGHSSGIQHTGMLTTMLRADAMAVLPPEQANVAAGEVVRAFLLGSSVEMLEE